MPLTKGPEIQGKTPASRPFIARCRTILVQIQLIGIAAMTLPKGTDRCSSLHSCKVRSALGNVVSSGDECHLSADSPLDPAGRRARLYSPIWRIGSAWFEAHSRDSRDAGNAVSPKRGP